jgi:hypothetical protein
MFSIAAKKRALFDDYRHLYSKVMLVLTKVAITEFSSTISFGSNNKLKYKFKNVLICLP